MREKRLIHTVSIVNREDGNFGKRLTNVYVNAGFQDIRIYNTPGRPKRKPLNLNKLCGKILHNEYGVSGKRYPIPCKDGPIEAKIVTIQILPDSCYTCESNRDVINQAKCNECETEKNILQISEIELKVLKCKGRN